MFVCTVALVVPVNADQTQDGVSEQIPAWVKTVFGYYAEGRIDEPTLINALEYLIDKGIISASVGTNDVKNMSENDDKISDDGDFYITYMTNQNSDYTDDDTALAWLKNVELLEDEVEFLNENFRLPYDIEIIAKECGFVNAFIDYDTLQIVICYELVDDVFETWYLFNEGGNVTDASDYSYNVINYILYHEIAHTIIHIYELPVTGLEEDVADQFAVLMASYTSYDGTDDYSPGQDILHDVVKYYAYEDEYWNVTCPGLYFTDEDRLACQNPYWNAHGLDIQRFYNVSCYTYGSDPEYSEYIVTDELLPEDMAVGCEDEYWQIAYAWDHLLVNYTNGFFD